MTRTDDEVSGPDGAIGPDVAAGPGEVAGPTDEVAGLVLAAGGGRRLGGRP
ncbi:nucleotidyltransferase family protein, partial [Streptomyces sp. SID8499]|nr:nucleotidyltransferase family protein [Streptomyces sp. SID8499]